MTAASIYFLILTFYSLHKVQNAEVSDTTDDSIEYPSSFNKKLINTKTIFI